MPWTAEQKQRISIAYQIMKVVRGISTETAERILFNFLLSLDPPPTILVNQIRQWVNEAKQQQTDANAERSVQTTASTTVITNLTELEGQLP